MTKTEDNAELPAGRSQPASLTLHIDELWHNRLARSIATVDQAKFPNTETLSQETCLTLIWTFWTLNGLIDEQLGAFGLSRVRLHVLAFLSRAEAEVRMTDIGDWLGVSKAQMTRLIDGLERDGLVRRSVSKTDRRAIFVEVTSAGRERLDAALPGHVAHLSHLMEGLNEEEKLALTHLLAKSRSSMLEASGRSPGGSHSSTQRL